MCSAVAYGGFAGDEFVMKPFWVLTTDLGEEDEGHGGSESRVLDGGEGVFFLRGERIMSEVLMRESREIFVSNEWVSMY